MKKTIALFIFLSLLLAGCSNTSSQPSDTSTAETTTAVTTSASPTPSVPEEITVETSSENFILTDDGYCLSALYYNSFTNTNEFPVSIDYVSVDIESVDGMPLDSQSTNAWPHIINPGETSYIECSFDIYDTDFNSVGEPTLHYKVTSSQSMPSPSIEISDTSMVVEHDTPQIVGHITNTSSDTYYSLVHVQAPVFENGFIVSIPFSYVSDLEPGETKVFKLNTLYAQSDTDWNNCTYSVQIPDFDT